MWEKHNFIFFLKGVCIPEKMAQPLGFVPWRIKIFLFNVALESIWFDSVKTMWDFMAEDSKANKKQWKNGFMKLSWAAKV